VLHQTSRRIDGSLFSQSCTDSLSASLIRTRDWRRGLKAKYPNDPRLGKAAETLDKLAGQTNELSDEAWTAICPFYNWSSGTWADAVSLTTGRFFIERGKMEMITAHRLRNLLGYSKTTGLFRWRVQTSNRIRVGQIAGCKTVRGFRKITIDGKTYVAHWLAVLHVRGHWPANNMTFRNFDRSDCRWRNLVAA
jgi:hypothetical protein